jgi:hypothetical protein
MRRDPTKPRKSVVHVAIHLVKRYFWAIGARPLNAADRAWVESWLLPGELELFDAMSVSDHEHHVRVTRRFLARLGDASPPREYVAASLLHDVGKLVCGLETHGRVFASLWPFGHHGDGRVGRYYRHEEIGVTLLRTAGSAPDTIALVGRWPDAPQAPANALLWADDL